MGKVQGRQACLWQAVAMRGVRVCMAVAVLTAAVAVAAKDIPKSTMKKLLGAQASADVVDVPPPMTIDSTLTPSIPFTPLAVSMYGYAKRVSDARETFVLRNETPCYHISRVLIKLVYTTQEGAPLHERTELVECDLRPGGSRMVSVKSFDSSRSYYYYTQPPRRAKGIPYKVRYDILRYDVVVE